MSELIKFVEQQARKKVLEAQSSQESSAERRKSNNKGGKSNNAKDTKNPETGKYEFLAGDTVNIHLKIKEGEKERTQQFQGTVMQRRHPSSNGETFTVRKISNGIGVERIFQILSPKIEKIEIIRRGSVRRARLYYLRGRQGKAARIKEKIVFTQKNTD